MASHAPQLNSAEFRFYQELGDFLPAKRRGVSFEHSFRGTPAVKDVIESLGIPHAEVDLILVDGRSVGFAHRLTGGERVAVYPMFESFDIESVTRLRPEPLRQPRFVLDVHLGALARLLRLMGFDARYDTSFEDAQIVRIAGAERRIILTRDVGLLKRGEVTHGYWLRSQEPAEQAKEVVRRFDLARAVRPFTRCPKCNGVLQQAERDAVRDRVPPRSLEAFDEFYECSICGTVYWRGSHIEDIVRTIDDILREAR